MGETKKREGWLPPRTGGYIPTRKSGGSATSVQSVGATAANAPKGGGGVGNIHLRKRDKEESE